jgi:hypothetical protein
MPQSVLPIPLPQSSEQDVVVESSWGPFSSAGGVGRGDGCGGSAAGVFRESRKGDGLWRAGNGEKRGERREKGRKTYSMNKEPRFRLNPKHMSSTRVSSHLPRRFFPSESPVETNNVPPLVDQLARSRRQEGGKAYCVKPATPITVPITRPCRSTVISSPGERTKRS